MTMIPKVSRRSFIVGSAAVGGGLALGLRLPPFGPAVVRAADGSPEINAWVVIRPDDTVVVRVARSEMGQGTITGLAQMVAEELECNWSKVVTEYPTPGESVKRKRVWGDFSTGGSRGIRESNEYVRRGGATARVMLVQAAAEEWKVPVAECTVNKGVITHTPSGRTTTYGKVAEAAARITPPKDVPLKDPKDWKIIGNKDIKRLDTTEKLTGKAMYGVDFKMPGMLNATIKECPVFGGKVKSFDAGKVKGMKGVKNVLQVGDTAVAVVADLVAGEGRARRAADRVGRGRERESVERIHRRPVEGGPRCGSGIRRQQERRRENGACRRGEKSRSRLRIPVPESRADGADERDGALHARAL